ncbi:Pimeloyl-ACP methyl ester carboxylesterase [Arthrobacter sp. yr096]|uniref:alpha/beta fold hydrolase n=1 Tax=Arthrobacter sp. yr096 TaxID=1761750 RepID=UPI0008C73998|nr:alpha/beta hydrolase [Arthrobacter sp. yr096]SEJ54888.1 Pimeloyl-ACP methyl ester carboxylesterase [Arthrobacter sp. yr096]
MDVQQQTGPVRVTDTWRITVPTELGPCTVRIQDGAGPESGTADVYLHGAAGSWTTFLPLMSRAPENDRILIDLPGWGDSTQAARLEGATIEAMASAVVEVLTVLGHRRWNIVGHSMGGFLALHIAAAWPAQTASVATISATTFGVTDSIRHPWRGLFLLPFFVFMLLLMRSTAPFGKTGTALIRGVGKTPIMRLLLGPLFANPAAIPERVIRRLAQEARPASFGAAARAAALYNAGQWRSICCPVLAIRGDRDVFTPQSDLEQLAALCTHVRTVTVPRCGHFATVEQPDTVQRLLTDLRQR